MCSYSRKGFQSFENLAWTRHSYFQRYNKRWRVFSTARVGFHLQLILLAKIRAKNRWWEEAKNFKTQVFSETRACIKRVRKLREFHALNGEWSCCIILFINPSGSRCFCPSWVGIFQSSASSGFSVDCAFAAALSSVPPHLPFAFAVSTGPTQPTISPTFTWRWKEDSWGAWKRWLEGWRG